MLALLTSALQLFASVILYGRYSPADGLEIVYLCVAVLNPVPVSNSSNSIGVAPVNVITISFISSFAQ